MKIVSILFFLIINSVIAQFNDSGSTAVSSQMNSGQQVMMSDYCSFLNEVATMDPHSLYDEKIGSPALSAYILRRGAPGSYYYKVIGDRKDFPISFLSWFNKARYCNWCQSKKSSSDQENRIDTEEGVYSLNGMDDAIINGSILKNPNAVYFLADDVNRDSDLALRVSSSYCVVTTTDEVLLKMGIVPAVGAFSDTCVDIFWITMGLFTGVGAHEISRPNREISAVNERRSMEFPHQGVGLGHSDPTLLRENNGANDLLRIILAEKEKQMPSQVSSRIAAQAHSWSTSRILRNLAVTFLALGQHVQAVDVKSHENHTVSSTSFEHGVTQIDGLHHVFPEQDALDRTMWNHNKAVITPTEEYKAKVDSLWNEAKAIEKTAVDGQIAKSSTSSNRIELAKSAYKKWNDVIQMLESPTFSLPKSNLQQAKESREFWSDIMTYEEAVEMENAADATRMQFPHGHYDGSTPKKSIQFSKVSYDGLIEKKYIELAELAKSAWDKASEACERNIKITNGDAQSGWMSKLEKAQERKSIYEFDILTIKSLIADKESDAAQERVTAARGDEVAQRVAAFESLKLAYVAEQAFDGSIKFQERCKKRDLVYCLGLKAFSKAALIKNIKTIKDQKAVWTKYIEEMKTWMKKNKWIDEKYNIDDPIPSGNEGAVTLDKERLAKFNVLMEKAIAAEKALIKEQKKGGLSVVKNLKFAKNIQKKWNDLIQALEADSNLLSEKEIKMLQNAKSEKINWDDVITAQEAMKMDADAFEASRQLSPDEYDDEAEKKVLQLAELAQQSWIKAIEACERNIKITSGDHQADWMSKLKTARERKGEIRVDLFRIKANAASKEAQAAIEKLKRAPIQNIALFKKALQLAQKAEKAFDELVEIHQRCEKNEIEPYHWLEKHSKKEWAMSVQSVQEEKDRWSNAVKILLKQKELVDRTF